MSDRAEAVEALAADPGRSGLVLDFDGVLAPIVADPTTSALPDRVAASLERLAGRLGLVAIISGRPVTFLAERVGLPGVPLLGSYGMEQSRDGVRQIDPEAEKWLGQIRRAGLTMREEWAGSAGIRVEEKSVSVAVHWRQAPDHAAAAGHRAHRRRAGPPARAGKAGGGAAAADRRRQGIGDLGAAGGAPGAVRVRLRRR
jgi:trehalose 6-phosphate phosphatase